jgi:hypothetical protein
LAVVAPFGEDQHRIGAAGRLQGRTRRQPAREPSRRLQAGRLLGAIFGLAGLLCVLATNPLRRSLDADRDRTASVHPRVLFSRRNLATPFRALARSPALLPLTALAFSFAVLIASWITFC